MVQLQASIANRIITGKALKAAKADGNAELTRAHLHVTSVS